MNRYVTMAALPLMTLTLALPGTAAMARTSMTPTTYVMKAGAGDQYEIQSSKLVLQTTQNPKIKAFANMMVMDHTKSTADVKAAAMQARLHPAAPKLDAIGMKDVAALRSAKGSMRDTLYVRQQKAAHQRALMLHEGYATSGTAAPLKTVAGNIAPVVKTHIETLAAM